MDWLDVMFSCFTVLVVLWFVGWFGTYRGQYILGKLTDLQLCMFSLFSGSLVISLALVAGYLISRTLY
jgi:hypothetical protein